MITPPQARGDHFSGVSSGYAEFRPRYPRSLYEFIADVAPNHDRVWDCGAGNGQASTDLAGSFRQVNASDLPDDQKLKIQSYITGCYGSLTSFNVLFANEEDKFKGTGGED